MVGTEQASPDQWYSRYKRRNRVESTVAALKRRLGGRIRAINQAMRLVEAGLKLVAWNLTRLRQGEF
jgi:transposase